MFKSFKKIFLRFKAQSNKKRLFLINLLGFLVITGGLLTWGITRYSADTNNPTSLEKLQAAPKPNFKPGNTLPRLSYWLNGLMPFDTAVELTENWGYALGLKTDEPTIDNFLKKPDSFYSKLSALASSNPDRYPVFLNLEIAWDYAPSAATEDMFCHLNGVNGTAATRVLTNAGGLTLSVAIDTDDTAVVAQKTINVTRPASGWIRINDENLAYSSFSGDTYTISERGAFGTAVSSHNVGAVIKDKTTQQFSPEAPTSAWRRTGDYWASVTKTILDRFPTIKTPVAINGAEYGLNVYGWGSQYWKQDPDVLLAKAAYNTQHGINNDIGPNSWYTYISVQKGRQDNEVASAYRAVLPADTLYITYLVSSSGYRNSLNKTAWENWGFEYDKLRVTTDLPSIESYWNSFYQGWVGNYNGDIFTNVTNAIGQQLQLGDPLTYDFVWAGCRQGRGTLVGSVNQTDMLITTTQLSASMPDSGTVIIDNEGMAYSSKDYNAKTLTISARGINGTITALHTNGAAVYQDESYIAESDRWLGYLKMRYAMGMVGAMQFYNTPSEDDPNWLKQMQSLGHVHALYSWLQDYLRNGDLLEGDGHNYWSKDQPSYEFSTGYEFTTDGSRVHVTARKKKTSNDWLIAAWAQIGVDRDVTVTIPVLGQVTVNARIAGSVYTAKLVDEKPVLTLIDVDAMNPTDGISGRVDDGETPPAPVLNLNRNFTYKSKITITGTKNAKVKKVSINNKEAQVDNNANTWSLEVDLVNGQNTLTILGQDDTSKSSSSITRTIIRRKIGDFNNDTKIDGSDFTLLLFNWGSLLSNNFGDFNEDGKVDGSDFTIMLYWWGR